MFNSLLDEALESWRDVRRGVVDELRNVPDDRMAFRAVDEARSVAELARHILEVGLMMVGELTREETDFTRRPFGELLREHAAGISGLEAKEPLIEALERTLVEGEARLRERGEIHMLQLLVRFDGRRGTRLAWFQHGVAHEMYHRGQLALYGRLMGIEPALTRRIRGG